MPQGKGTYGNKRGRPKKNLKTTKGLTEKQKKNLPKGLKDAIMKSKNKK